MKRSLAIVMIAAALLVACGDDEPTGPQPETFSATLTGSAERPDPVTTTAAGSATVTYLPASGSFTYTLSANNITGVTVAHIHGPATTEQSAGVIVPLVAPVTSASVSGTFTSANITANGVSSDSLLALLRNGRAYVNVHTTANPLGHIRGQLTAN